MRASILALVLVGLLSLTSSGCAEESKPADGADSAAPTDSAPGADTAAADTTASPDTGEAPDTASVPDTLPPRDCHYDCFGGYTCREGTFYELLYAPIPCSRASGSQPPEGWCAHYGKPVTCGDAGCGAWGCAGDVAWFEALRPAEAAPFDCRVTDVHWGSPSDTWARVEDVNGTTVVEIGASSTTGAGALGAVADTHHTRAAALEPAQVDLGGLNGAAAVVSASFFSARAHDTFSGGYDFCAGGLTATLDDGRQAQLTWWSHSGCARFQQGDAQCVVRVVTGDR